MRTFTLVFWGALFYPVLETLGIVGASLHSSAEYAELDSTVPRLYLTVRMIQELS